MAREFRLDLKITLPDGDFEEAEALVALKPTVDAFEESIRKVAGDVVLSYAVATPRPRGADKGDPVAQYTAAGGRLPA